MVNVSDRSFRTFVPTLFALLLGACGGGGGGEESGSVTHAIGGTISGLTSPGLEISLGSEALPVDASATSFRFSQRISDRITYQVVVTQQPAGQTCSLDQGSGMAVSDNLGLRVTCAMLDSNVAGSVSGLTQGQLNLNLNAGVEVITVSAGDPGFAFSTPLANGAPFTIDIELPVNAADQPKAICKLSTSEGTVGTVDVTNLALTCRSLGSISTVESGQVDRALVALNVNLNANSDAAVSWANFGAVGNTYAQRIVASGMWAPRIDVVTSDGGVSQILNSSVLLDDANNWSLVNFIDTFVAAEQWTSQLTDNIAVNMPALLSSDANASGTASKLAAIEVELGGDRLKLIAADNNNVNEPICIYRQYTTGNTVQAFCIPASGEMLTGAGSVNAIDLAVHIDANGTTGRGMVVWEQDASLQNNDVRRIHGAQFSLDGSNMTVKVIEGEADSSSSQFGRPSVTTGSPKSDYGFFITFEKPEQVPAFRYVDQYFEIDNFDSDMVFLENASGGTWSFRLKPRLITMQNGDMLLTYIAERWIGGLFDSSALLIRRIEFDSTSRTYSYGALAASSAIGGRLLSHYALDADKDGNVLVVYRRSRRSDQGGNVALELDEIEHVYLPASGGLELLNADGIISSQEYDDDPSSGGDDRIELWYSKSDTVLGVDFSDSGNAMIVWSEWDTADDANSVKAVTLGVH